MSQLEEPPTGWAQAQQAPAPPSQESTEPFDGRPLPLTDELTEALRALARFAEESPTADLWGRRPESAEGVAAGRTRTALVALGAATAVVQSDMPSCPYRPPGMPVTIQYLPPNNKLVQRCGHVNPAHCWEGYGSIPYQC
jgi:hypothetical protein